MFPFILLYASLVNDVRGLIAQHDQAAAVQAVRTYQSQSGATPELAAALSWLARDALAAKRLDQADSYAAETRTMALQLLKSRSLDSDAYLPTALGASIEVHAQALAAQGDRAEAVGFLLEQLQSFADTSISERIHKNLNLLSLEGKPAPPFATNEWLGPQPQALAALRGHPVLLFFWAHWCPDCKAEIPIVQKLMAAYGPLGLVVVAPTQHYGYVAGGADAPPAVETKYIGEVFAKYYAGLGPVEIPLSEDNFRRFGVSTTPTIVLIDANGIVRLYNPGAASYETLASRIESMMRVRG
jgi:thiol-disulfide isomerase/thioredoxin